MMFLGTTRKATEIRPEQQWDAISLRDFKPSSFFTYLAYGYLYFSILLSLAVYGVDIFTAINLLAFNHWSSSIEPTQLLTFQQSKWIFAGAILASLVNLIFEHFRAWRVMKRGGVAESYLDNLAVRLQSIRVGSGQGWRRFLVFAELTKSKKGAEYVALFSYFSLQAWIRVLVCSGPRQVVNALTLYGVYKINLTPTDDSSVESTLGGFFTNLETLAAENTQQAVILSGMIFTLVIWLFSFVYLLLGVLFYVFFLWHYIPRQDGGLHGYCERKVNKRLMAIVSQKINRALAKGELRRMQGSGGVYKSAPERPSLARQATLPSLNALEQGKKLPTIPTVSRNDTMSTLPVYTSRPGTPPNIELSSFDQKRPAPQRQGTNATVPAYSSRAPLVATAADMGRDSTPTREPTIPNLDMSGYPEPLRLGASRQPLNNAPGDDTLPPMPSEHSGRPPPASAPNSYNKNGPSPYGRPPPNRPPYAEGRSITAPSLYSSNRLPPRPAPAPPSSSGYRGASHNNGPGGRSATAPIQQQQRFPPPRNMTAPQPMRPGNNDYYPGGQRSYNDGYNEYNNNNSSRY
ncbi:hypothetical protein GGR50DRAFT_382659 [Xylaria sp. CBS 124048]|nr:hypothetical protein GGR50DRAFT_382659 [Xylaria sp. CBS 124048]